jgi:hypothetical protein
MDFQLLTVFVIKVLKTRQNCIYLNKCQNAPPSKFPCVPLMKFGGNTSFALAQGFKI